MTLRWAIPLGLLLVVSGCSTSRRVRLDVGHEVFAVTPREEEGAGLAESLWLPTRWPWRSGGCAAGVIPILVATKLIRCIDDKASREVLQVFRIWGWDVALIVSEDIKQALERAKATGVKFTEV